MSETLTTAVRPGLHFNKIKHAIPETGANSIVTLSQMNTKVETETNNVTASITSSSSAFVPYIVHYVVTTNRATINNFSDLGASVGEYIVLTGQTTASENGLYKQDTASTASQQTLSENTYFVNVNNGVGVMYDHSNVSFTEDTLQVLRLNKSVSTSGTTPAKAFDIPVPLNSSVMLDLNVIAVPDTPSGATDCFIRMTKRALFNVSGTVYDSGNQMIQTIDKTSGYSGVDVTFTETTAGSVYTVNVVGKAATNLSWWVKGKMEF